MGLDIYFYKVRKDDADTISNTREVFDLINDGVDCAYFRKANFIYAYFEHLIDSNTECCIVNKDEIESLFDACSLVLERQNEKDFAEQVLPTCDGFFFGTMKKCSLVTNKCELSSTSGKMKTLL